MSESRPRGEESLNITLSFESDMDTSLLVVGNWSLIATDPAHPEKAIVLLRTERDDHACNAEWFLDSQRRESGIEENAFGVEECVRAVEEEVINRHVAAKFVGDWGIKGTKSRISKKLANAWQKKTAPFY